MRRNPSEPYFQGCGLCSPMPVSVQDRIQHRMVGYDYGLCDICFYEKGNDEPVETHFLGDYVGEETTFEEIEKVFEKEINLYEYVEVYFISALRGEEYEYNKEDGNWYLTGQNPGWA